MSSLASTTPSPPPPPRPKTPFTYVVYVYSDMSLSKGHLGSRGGASKNKLKDTIFTFPVTNVTVLSILSVNEKLPVSKFRYFGKYIIQLFGHCYVHVSGQRQAGFERLNSNTSPGTMVHVMHVHFMFFAVFKNLKSSFSEKNMPGHTHDIFIENATKMV